MVNISIYNLLSGSSYIESPCRSRNSMKSLINIKNNNNKHFLWCHIRHFNKLKTHPERITKVDKNMINDLDYEGIEFPVSKKDFNKIFALMCFVIKTIWFILFMYQMKNLKIVWIYS